MKKSRRNPWIFFPICILSLLLGTLQAASIRHLASLGPGGGGATFSAVFHNKNADIILVAQDVGGVYKTTNGGKTWVHVNNRGLLRPELGEDVTFVDELVAHPTADNRFFACTASGLFRSDDVGESWSQVIPVAGSAIPEMPVAWVAFSPLDSSLGLAGTGTWHEPDRGFGLYRTTNGGMTFSLVDGTGIPKRATISSIVFDPDDGTVYASTTSGLYTSSDRGSTFTRVAFAFRHDQGQWVGIGGSGATKTIWYVLYTLGEDGDPSSRSGGIYRSPDAVTWTEITGEPTVNDPENNELMRTLGAQVHPGDPSILFVNFRTDGGQGGLYRWNGTWANITETFVDETWSAGTEFSPIAPEGVTVDAANPNLILSCNEKALIKSSDGGTTWTQLSMRKIGADRWSGTGAEVVVTYALAGSGDIMYAAFEDIGFWRSDDRGATWKQLLWPGAVPDTIRPDGATGIVIHPDDRNRLYLLLGSFSNAIREGDVRPELHKSLDGGETTLDVTPPAPPGPQGRGTMAVVWGGTPEQDTLFAAFHGDTIYKSTDGGTGWTEVSTGFAPGDEQLIFRITVDPANPNVVYAGLNTDMGTFAGPGGVYRSSDGGSTWKHLDGYPYQDVGWLRFAGEPPRLFAGGWTNGDGGLRVSDDGTTFTEVLTQPFVTAVADVPGSPGTLYAASSSHFARGTNQSAGIYRSKDNGATWKRLEGNLQHSRNWDILILPDQPNVLYLASDGDGILAVEVDDRSRHFAHYGDGGGISSTLLLINPSTSEAALGTVRIFDSLGAPLFVEINGTMENGEFPFDIPPQGIGFFASGNTAANVRVGSVEVDTEDAVGGTILFSSSDGVAGVGAVQPSSTRFILPVEGDTATGLSTGVALSNQSPTDVTATLTIRRVDGTPLANGVTRIPLASRNQLPRFVDQLFSGSGIDFSSLKATLEIESPVPITGLALLISPGQFATLPVTPLGFGRKQLNFSQFGDGQGISSTLLLINPSPTQTATGTVKLFDDPGTPLVVDINGAVETDGEFTFELPPLGMGLFATDGVGDSILTGSVEVESDTFVAGTILFAGSFGVAGVGSVEPSRRFLVPVDSDSAQEVSTGVALANPQNFSVEVTLRLRNSGGVVLTGGIATITLPAHGHLARFPWEIYQGSGIDFALFRGTLEVESLVPIAGMAIRISPGEMATFPVTAEN